MLKILNASTLELKGIITDYKGFRFNRVVNDVGSFNFTISSEEDSILSIYDLVYYSDDIVGFISTINRDIPTHTTQIVGCPLEGYLENRAGYYFLSTDESAQSFISFGSDGTDQTQFRNMVSTFLASMNNQSTKIMTSNISTGIACPADTVIPCGDTTLDNLKSIASAFKQRYTNYNMIFYIEYYNTGNYAYRLVCKYSGLSSPTSTIDITSFNSSNRVLTTSNKDYVSNRMCTVQSPTTNKLFIKNFAANTTISNTPGFYRRQTLYQVDNSAIPAGYTDDQVELWLSTVKASYHLNTDTYDVVLHDLPQTLTLGSCYRIQDREVGYTENLLLKSIEYVISNGSVSTIYSFAREV